LKHALGVLVRLSLVVGVHVAALLALLQLHPDIRSRVEPVLVSLISPQPPVVPVTPPPSPPVLASRVEPQRLPAHRQAASVASSPQDATRETSKPATALAEPSAPLAAAESPPATFAAPATAPSAIAESPAPVVPPRFDAAYLDNPHPEYPRIARRLGEYGKVILRVYVTASGRADKVEIRTSSGSPRLDQAARDAVERWKFVPARRGDEPVAAWVLVPIAFVLEG